MLSLMLVGLRLEQQFGFVRVGVIYLVSGIGGSMMSTDSSVDGRWMPTWIRRLRPRHPQGGAATTPDPSVGAADSAWMDMLPFPCRLHDSHGSHSMDQDDHRDLHGDAEALHMVELHGTTVPRCGAAKLGHISASGTLHADVLCLIILTTIVVGVFYMLFISWPTSMFANHPSASCYMIPT
ncbi:uncharacterized protein LOC125548797 [Triticum urartu]|uniref:uncharacterized protein LOC125548797 n=1 Tax=Triticum urartu TaxID=4572 RepID=UPI0020446CA9|nr:uncharacterized protein LOC125548797 [Triticum urartu]